MRGRVRQSTGSCQPNLQQSEHLTLEDDVEVHYQVSAAY